MRRTTANNRTQVVMEPTFAKHPVLKGEKESFCNDVLCVHVGVCEWLFKS